MHCFLNHIGRCGLVFLLDASLVIEYVFNHIGRRCNVFLLDAGLVIGCILFLIALVVIAMCSCWMPAWSLDAYFLDHIDRCGLVFLLDANPVIGCLSS